MNKIIACILYLVCSCIAGSCKKYLNEKPSDYITYPDNLDGLQALLDNVNIMNDRTGVFGEASCDEFFLPDNTYKSIGQGLGMAVYTWKPYHYNWTNDWSNAYLAVYNCNLVLDVLKDIPRTAENELQWRRVKGSAHFYKAFHYLNLIWTFGKAYDPVRSDTDMGIVLRKGPDFNVASTRSSVKESYEQIISDAKEAVSLLAPRPDHFFRPSASAAYGVLARTYLSMRDYPNALKYADSCLHVNGRLMDYNESPAASAATNPFPSPAAPTLNPEIIFYSIMYADNINIHTQALARIDSLLYASYDDNDWRKDAFFFKLNGFERFTGSYAGDLNTLFSGIATDEMYLIRAECNARANKVEEALSDLNLLLSKRWKNNVSFVPITATGPADALDKILLERRKELLMRGVRWIDIKRLNKEGRQIMLRRVLPDGIATLMPNANYYALPLPDDIISTSGIMQNPQD